jgi:hypothetical protein
MVGVEEMGKCRLEDIKKQTFRINSSGDLMSI